ncbi:MAG: cupin domain-containing protein [Chloracidobacterium sp.]|nr:cupin domain-containing protein [Chloracidobacterium sp.]
MTRAGDVEWVAGRAGMEYRDLIPGRMGGKLIASHIRIPNAGEVSDYVHYHKVAFQMIYCRRGRVKVVYEDQGDAFWLEPGDCVLQPPEIRHRVLEAAANTEVIELTSPALHETWADHDLDLPTGRLDPERIFNGQRFVHYRVAGSTPMPAGFGGFETFDLGIAAASGNAASAFVLRSPADHAEFTSEGDGPGSSFFFLLDGTATVTIKGDDAVDLSPDDAILILPNIYFTITAPPVQEFYSCRPERPWRLSLQAER